MLCEFWKIWMRTIQPWPSDIHSKIPTSTHNILSITPALSDHNVLPPHPPSPPSTHSPIENNSNASTIARAGRFPYIKNEPVWTGSQIKRFSTSVSTSLSWLKLWCPATSTRGSSDKCVWVLVGGSLETLYVGSRGNGGGRRLRRGERGG